TDSRAHHERDASLLARDVPELRGLVDEAVHRQSHEVAEHDLEDGSQPGHRGPIRCARERQLGDRRVEHALRPESLEKLGGDLEHAARGRDVRAKEHYGGIALELLGEGVANRNAELEGAHGRNSVPATLCGSGYGAASAPSTA